MTYCVGVMLDEGLVFASDSRTNAGVDNISKFCKMTVFEYRGDRVIVLLSSGNLAGTQAVIGLLNKRCDVGSNTPSLWNARTMFDAAMLVADAMRDIERRDGVYLEQSDISFNASFIMVARSTASRCGCSGCIQKAISSRRAPTHPIFRPAKPSMANPSSNA